MSIAEILLSSVFCFFALYGIVQISFKVLKIFKKSDYPQKNNIFTVITVKNQEHSIEGIIRSIVWKALNSENGDENQDIVIVDLGSNDETVNIIKRLEKEFEFVHAMDKNTYVQSIQVM